MPNELPAEDCVSSWCQSVNTLIATDATFTNFFQAGSAITQYVCTTNNVDGSWETAHPEGDDHLTRVFNGQANGDVYNSRVAAASENGMYVINYHVTDAHNNLECDDTSDTPSDNKRTVVVKDTLPPVISLTIGGFTNDDGETAQINHDQVNHVHGVGLGGDENPAVSVANDAFDDAAYEAPVNNFPLYEDHDGFAPEAGYMAEATTASSNGWVIAGVASAVTGLALLSFSSRRTAAVIEV